MLASIDGVATFYMQCRRDPVGKHVIGLCDGTACPTIAIAFRNKEDIEACHTMTWSEL